ncbi:hypothetical protein GJ496_008515 [Pomphorhynchus laevis]|nr:hypothetical protein GJ496_008515 [Pomphorhynchus laevis]
MMNIQDGPTQYALTANTGSIYIQCVIRKLCVHCAKEHISISCFSKVTRKFGNCGGLHKANDHRCSAFIVCIASIQSNAELKHYSNTGTVVIKSSSSALSFANATINYNNLDPSNIQDSKIKELEQIFRDQQTLIERLIITIDKLTALLSSIREYHKDRHSLHLTECLESKDIRISGFANDISICFSTKYKCWQVKLTYR